MQLSVCILTVCVESSKVGEIIIEREGTPMLLVSLVKV